MALAPHKSRIRFILISLVAVVLFLLEAARASGAAVVLLWLSYSAPLGLPCSKGVEIVCG